VAVADAASINITGKFFYRAGESFRRGEIYGTLVMASASRLPTYVVAASACKNYTGKFFC